LHPSGISTKVNASQSVKELILTSHPSIYHKYDAEDKTQAELLAAERGGVHMTMGTADVTEGIMAFFWKNECRYLINRIA
jgi:hypothetical protein